MSSDNVMKIRLPSSLEGCACLLSSLLLIVSGLELRAQTPLPPQVTFTKSNANLNLWWTPYPAAQQYNVVSGTNLNNPLTPDTNGLYRGYNWSLSNAVGTRFFAVNVTPLSSNELLSANILNRLAYGPSPDDLEHVKAIGPQAYIDEQLAPESVTETYDVYTSVVTNGAGVIPGSTNWQTMVVTGSWSSATLYMYLTTVGEVYVDDVQLSYLYRITAITNNGVASTTNLYTNITANLLVNGDFEQDPTNGWALAANVAGSESSPDAAYSGSRSLRLVSTAPGSTGTSGFQQTVVVPVTTRGTNEGTGEVWTNTVTALRGILRFFYLPNADSDKLTLRLSGSGTIASGAEPSQMPAWIYATATGKATTTPNLYIYLSGAGEAYIDDIKIVAGSVPEVGPNLVRNGDFEFALSPSWVLTSDFTNSYISSEFSRSGAGSLKIVATAGGGGSGDSVYQVVSPGLTNGQTYTVSFWYTPATRGRTLTVRLSGSLLNSTPDSTVGNLRRRLDQANFGASLDQLRQWFCHNAVGAKRQLIEVLSQFFENHFVTYHSKTTDYFDRYYDGLQDEVATDLEYREMSRWRNALLNPNCTFYDLLKIHAESPAQIIYLDTVGSRGDGSRVANENYARELFELYCMGVDNGYEQFDITVMSRAWTGWTVGIVSREDIDNPFAAAGGGNSSTDANLLRYGYYPGNGYNAVSNIIGVWTFIFNPNWHGTNRAPILSVWDTNSPATNPRPLGPKLVPARFGPPWAGQSYQLSLPARTGTNGIQDGYDVIRHLSELPFTAEYISVKLCRLFIHDEFPNPTTRPELPEYSFYDYTNPNRSPEAELVRRCIEAWDTPGPDGRKGNMRLVLRTIFDSELFRSHAGSRQKVKTPLEFVVSAIRSMYSVNPDGTATAFTDGNISSPLSRMGVMSLFNRADPDGYPETGSPWISAGTLAERLRFAQVLCTASGNRGGLTDAGNNTVDPVALLKKMLPDGMNDADAVATFFANLLYAGEGLGNLSQYRQLAVNFLNTAEDGVTPSLFSSLSNTSTTYDTRVRGAVSMLMTLQRFQEQ